ncbi:hypothetical protein G9464_20870 [Halostella sp. JP-L12]|uniref:hypothetical protein n=1 Tax=Halostella TaxID=1843185 RepID=UPI0013CEA29E|nr:MULTISPECIES: hypothetical protein [Halostella]NHN50025.1 hypothetical protein [Halostella sp. JP-L12]
MVDRETKLAFQKQMDIRDRGETPPDAGNEFETQVRLAIELGYLSSIRDTTPYAPVTLQQLDLPGGASSKQGDITPIGRKRMRADQAQSPDDVAPVISHEDCEHILVVALPRQGKDSTIASICGNLKDEHPYKWFSCYDDGRNETPMIATPSDDEGIKENLEEFGQGPKGYETVVYVPATSGVPEVLPSNYERFTIGIDDLTPKLILHLAGVTTNDQNTMRRVGKALNEVQQTTGEVEDLVSKLKTYAEEVEATITVEEIADDEFREDEDGNKILADAEEVEASEGEIREIHYQMDEDALLEDCADALMMLAGEGLIEDTGAETNLDLVEEFKKDRVAVLNCNFLKDRNEGLKYLVQTLWYRFIFRIRDEHPRLPRAALESREIDNLAPSKLGQTDYRKQIKALRNTLYDIAQQGGSRRVMLIGSTQKLNEVSKAVRTNMPIKILLKLGAEEIKTLDDSFNFSHDQKEQLQSFSTGWGMLLNDGRKDYPIQWRGARCGLGSGDEHWRDRYGKSWGARVRQYHGDGWLKKHGDRDLWIDVLSGTVYELDTESEVTPELGQWHLFPSDLPGDARPVNAGDTVDDEVIDAALERRREHDIPSDLSLRRVEDNAERRLSFLASSEADEKKRKRVMQEFGIPKAVSHWINEDTERRDNYIWILEEIHRDESGTLTSGGDIAEATDVVAERTVYKYINDPRKLGHCVEKENGVFKLTSIGEKAIKADWDGVEEVL